MAGSYSSWLPRGTGAGGQRGCRLVLGEVELISTRRVERPALPDSSCGETWSLSRGLQSVDRILKGCQVGCGGQKGDKGREGETDDREGRGRGGSTVRNGERGGPCTLLRSRGHKPTTRLLQLRETVHHCGDLAGTEDKAASGPQKRDNWREDDDASIETQSQPRARPALPGRREIGRPDQLDHHRCAQRGSGSRAPS